MSRLKWVPLLGIAVYFACLALPLRSVHDYWSALAGGVQGSIRHSQAIGIAGFLGLALSGIFLVDRRSAVPNPGAWLAAALLCAWCALTAAWSLSPGSSLLYSGMLAAFFVSGASFWCLSDEDIAKSARAACLVLSACLGVLFLVLPIKARTLGGISPNLFGHFGLALLVLAYVSRWRFRWPFIIGGIALIAFAEARTVLISTMLFAVFHAFMGRIRNRSQLANAALVAVLLVAFLGVIAGPTIRFVSDVSSQLVGVTDYSRSADSGFTGRTEHWANGLRLIEDHEFTGYGFRTRSGLALASSGFATSAHSGFLNTLLDIGIPGALLFLASYIIAISSGANNWVDRLDANGRIGAAFLAAMLPTLFAEPNYANFAHPTSFLVLLFMARPLVIAPRRAPTSPRPSAQRPMPA